MISKKMLDNSKKSWIWKKMFINLKNVLEFKTMFIKVKKKWKENRKRTGEKIKKKKKNAKPGSGKVLEPSQNWLGWNPEMGRPIETSARQGHELSSWLCFGYHAITECNIARYVWTWYLCIYFLMLQGFYEWFLIILTCIVWKLDSLSLFAPSAQRVI
mgnify:CR=1 FL=1